MSLLVYSFLTVALVGAEVLYLRMARYFGWFDKPNQRSSHTNLISIRGGGVVFYLAIFGAFMFTRFNQPLFFLGLTLVTLVSFWDDLYSVPKRYRLGMQMVAVGLLLSQTSLFSGQWWLFIGVLLVGIGMLNVFNFMDGINGMTAFYGLVTIGTIWYWQTQILQTKLDPLLPVTGIALLIFSYFNARKQAICFAGDVGSMSIGFIILYFLSNLINQSQTYLPLLFVAVYGVDTVLTLGHRLYLRQNIFLAHRLHLFQTLVHEGNWPHLRVSALYALVQLSINGLIVTVIEKSLRTQFTVVILMLAGLISAYAVVKWQISQNKKRVGLEKPTPLIY